LSGVVAGDALPLGSAQEVAVATSSALAPGQLAARLLDVRKTYRKGPRDAGFAALRGVSLEIGTGGFIGLMGPSGSGKSTILNLVGGLDSPDSGSVETLGRPLAGMSDAALSDLRLRSVGFVFQFFNLLPNLTACRNVEIPLRLAGASDREARERALEALRRVGLGEKGERKPHELSGGEMQRVAIARAVAHQPALILADEPTGNLDRATGRQILELLRDLARRDGLTVLMATHDPRGREFCDRLIHMQDGLVADGPGEFETGDH